MVTTTADKSRLDYNTQKPVNRMRSTGFFLCLVDHSDHNILRMQLAAETQYLEVFSIILPIQFFTLAWNFPVQVDSIEGSLQSSNAINFSGDG